MARIFHLLNSYRMTWRASSGLASHSLPNSRSVHLMQCTLDIICEEWLVILKLKAESLSTVLSPEPNWDSGVNPMIRRLLPSVLSAKKKGLLSLYRRLVFHFMRTWNVNWAALRCVLFVKMRVVLTKGKLRCGRAGGEPGSTEMFPLCIG